MEPIFEPASLIVSKRRALHIADGGARFLMARAAEDLGDRLGTVERRFAKAAALFSATPDAAAVLRDHRITGAAVVTETGRLIGVLSETDLVDLAIELDIAVGERISRMELLEEVIPALAELARVEGLPLSAYDLEDLQALPIDHLRALAERLGLAPDPKAIIRAGEKVYRVYRKKRERSQIPLLLPMLLGALARYLAAPRAAG